jgi:hypothetical protein
MKVVIEASFFAISKMIEAKSTPFIPNPPKSFISIPPRPSSLNFSTFSKTLVVTSLVYKYYKLTQCLQIQKENQSCCCIQLTMGNIS